VNLSVPHHGAEPSDPRTDTRAQVQASPTEVRKILTSVEVIPTEVGSSPT
jgi:hypothetical protein